MFLHIKRRLLVHPKFVIVAFLVLYVLIFYFSSGKLDHPAACKYLAVKTSGDDRDGTGEHKAESNTNASFDTGPSLGVAVKDDGKDRIFDSEEQIFIAPGNADSAPADLDLKREKYIRAILNPKDTSTPRLSCPHFSTERYDHLTVTKHERRLKYFFALDLREVADLLPRLMGSAVEAMRYLGPRNCVLSVVEGNSDDGTWEVLSALGPHLEALGVTYFLRSSDTDPGASDDRIGSLAELRSQALEPLRNSRNDTARSLGLPGSELDFAEDATVVFLNDVAACAEDIFELLHQRAIQGADMTCAMDWHYPGGRDAPSIFYDVWISRTLSGNLFFDIPEDGTWDKSDYLLPFDPDARARFASRRPFQVFSCWNGAVAFTAKPLLDGKVNFRGVEGGECFQGEPQLFCKDMWFNGYGRIAVVPSVNLEYSDERGRWVKEDRGYASDWTAKARGGVEDAPAMKIDWKGPPQQVKCMPEFTRQSWLLWNESLVGGVVGR